MPKIWEHERILAERSNLKPVLGQLISSNRVLERQLGWKKGLAASDGLEKTSDLSTEGGGLCLIKPGRLVWLQLLSQVLIAIFTITLLTL